MIPEPPLLLRRLLENMATAVILVDETLTVEYMNPSAEMLFEVSLQRARGMQVRELMLDAQDLCDSLKTTLVTEHPFSDREREMRLLSGQSVTVDCTVTPISEPDEPPQLLLELARIDRAMRINREELLLNQQATTRALLRGLAHEVKNPLGGLRGAAQLLERELPEDELKEYTHIIIEEADRLQNLVNRMLGPRNLPNKTELNLHEIVEHVRQLVEVETPNEVVIQTDYDPSIPPLMADRDQLIQVVLNILRNAVEAVGARGEITVATRVQRQHTIGGTRHRLSATLAITDDGPGIPKDMQARIFFPMVSGNPEGTGLGLSIAQSIVQQHGGLIECRSRPGRTQFRIIIPVESKDD
jgi:two-component system nitrogen regulation sensor histidine kinase GlnL